jgi:hypothetical protein
MQRSEDRILTTHTGSLPRPPGPIPFAFKIAQAGSIVVVC